MIGTNYCLVLNLLINSAIHSSTKESPFRCDIGRQPHSPQIWNGMQISTNNESANSLALRLNCIASRITNNLRIAQEAQKRNYDKSHSEISFNVGDKVLLKRTHINLAAFNAVKKKKLLQAYVGPFTITERIGQLAYRLKLPRGFKNAMMYSMFLLYVFIICHQVTNLWVLMHLFLCKRPRNVDFDSSKTACTPTLRFRRSLNTPSSNLRMLPIG